MCRSCLQALEYLHACGVIHRDMKSDSVLLNSNNKVRHFNFTFGYASYHYKYFCSIHNIRIYIYNFFVLSSSVTFGFCARVNAQQPQ